MADPQPRQHPKQVAAPRRELQALFREKGEVWSRDVDVPIVVDWIFDELVCKMRALARHRFGNLEDAKDFVGDFLVTVVGLLQRYDPARVADKPNPSPKGLLLREFTRVLTRAWERSRQRSCEQATSADPQLGPLGFAVSREPDPAEVAELAELRPIIEAAIKELPERQEIAVRLYYFQNLTCPEIAEIMDSNPVAVHQLLHRAREQLKEILAR